MNMGFLTKLNLTWSITCHTSFAIDHIVEVALFQNAAWYIRSFHNYNCESKEKGLLVINPTDSPNSRFTFAVAVWTLR